MGLHVPDHSVPLPHLEALAVAEHDPVPQRVAVGIPGRHRAQIDEEKMQRREWRVLHQRQERAALEEPGGLWIEEKHTRERVALGMGGWRVNSTRRWPPKYRAAVEAPLAGCIPRRVLVLHR